MHNSMCPWCPTNCTAAKTPILPQTQLKEMGFAAAIYPSAALFAAARTRTNGLQSRAAINLAATTVFPKAVVGEPDQVN